VLVTSSVLEEAIEEDLPLYVTEPIRAGTHTDGWRVLWRRACTAMTPPAQPMPAPRPTIAPTSGYTSASFFRVIELPGDALTVVVLRWWTHVALERRAPIGGGLLVSALRVDPGMYSLRGQLRRGVLRRRLPVVVELWAHNAQFTRVSMVPRARVLTSRRYFRVGNRALDGLARELIDLAT
jgi:hypothetical protein